MSFTIIHDAEKKIAALVDAEYGRALGPIALGEAAVNVLEKFAGIHGVDPATVPSGILEARFRVFMEHLSEPIAADGEKIIQLADEVLGGVHAAHAGAEQADPSAGPGTVAESTGKPAPTPSPQAVIDPSEAVEHAPEAAKPERPVTTPKEGYVICPECDGWGEIAGSGGVVQCSVCKGEGQLPAHQEPTPAGTGG